MSCYDFATIYGPLRCFVRLVSLYNSLIYIKARHVHQSVNLTLSRAPLYIQRLTKTEAVKLLPKPKSKTGEIGVSTAQMSKLKLT